LARRIASSSSAKVWIAATGPKISSWTQSAVSGTLKITVGG
jgi:hypothetical protein